MKKKIKLPTAYSILILLMIVIAIITQFIPELIPATLMDVIMAPVNGMIGVKDIVLGSLVTEAMQDGGVANALTTLKDAGTPFINVWNTGKLSGAIDVAFFVLIIGGFLGVIDKTKSLDAGVATIVKKLKGKELYLIPILMIIFSLGGTSYGMAEESLAFYMLITTTMMVAGFDPIVAVSTVMLGAGAGVLGSTINPFAVGVAVSAGQSVGVELNQGIIILINSALWLSTLSIAIYFTMRYAKKVQNKYENSILSKEELENAKSVFLNNKSETVELTTKRKIVLWLFGFTFIIMIMGAIPWDSFGIEFFNNYTGFLTGSALGYWSFQEFTAWFFLMAIIIGFSYGFKEDSLVKSFIAGASDMVGVAIILGISRGVSFIMTNTGLDLYILDKTSSSLSGVNGIVFVVLALVIFIGLSFLIPSTSGLATVAMPIFLPLAVSLALPPEIIVSIFCAGSGIVNLVAPTSGIVMGGLGLAKVEYSSWLKYIWKVLLFMTLASTIIMSIAVVLL